MLISPGIRCSGYVIFPGLRYSGHVIFPGIRCSGYVIFRACSLIGKMNDFCLKLDQSWVNRGSWLVFRYVLCRACTVPGMHGSSQGMDLFRVCTAQVCSFR